MPAMAYLQIFRHPALVCLDRFIHTFIHILYNKDQPTDRQTHSISALSVSQKKGLDCSPVHNVKEKNLNMPPIYLRMIELSAVEATKPFIAM